MAQELILFAGESHSQLNADGTRKRGRPKGSRKLYLEISQESRIALVPVLVKCNDTALKYLKSGFLQHIQIIGTRTFFVFKDNSQIEI